MLLLNKLYFKGEKNVSIILRFIVIVFNELAMIVVICCSNLAEQGGLGLVVNFSAALIICEIDDILMTTGRVQALKDYYNNLEDESVGDEI